MNTMVYSVSVLGGLGLLFGIILSLASKAFAVETDPKVEEIRKVLPGANCGACGFPGCDGLADAIVRGEAEVSGCSVGGQPVADKVGAIMGVDAIADEKMVATVLCQGNDCKAKEKFEYDGIEDCRAANQIAGGSKACNYGCLGFGTCQTVCQFDAINIVDGVAVIDREKCTGCKKCLEVCPKNIIEMVPYEQKTVVKCFSNDSGKVVRKNCSIGCIGCGICVKNCPFEAITMEDNLAKIDYDKCYKNAEACGICAEICPTGAIWTNLEKVLENIKEKERIKEERKAKALAKAKAKAKVKA